MTVTDWVCSYRLQYTSFTRRLLAGQPHGGTIIYVVISLLLAHTSVNF